MRWQHESHRLLHLKQSDVIHTFQDMSKNVHHLAAEYLPTITKRDGFSGTGTDDSGDGSGSSSTASSNPKYDAPANNNTLSIVLGVV